MKRFIPFMCALLIAVSASAATISTKSARSSAPRAKNQVFDLTIHKDYGTSTWYYNDVWGFSMYNLDHTVNIALAFDLADDGTTSPVYGKTYKKRHLVDNQSWISTYDTIKNEYTNSTISEIEFTWTVDVDSLNHFSGFAKDTLGNTYNFHYDEQEFAITGDTIKIDTKTVSTFSYNEYGSPTCWYVNYSDNNYYVSFSLLSNKANSPAGVYNFAAFNEYGNNLTINHGHWSERIEYLDGKVTITEANDTTFLQATLLGNDGNIYAMWLYYADPKPLYHETIKANNLEVDSAYIQWGSVHFAAADSTYQIDFSVAVDTTTRNFYHSFVMGDSLYTPTLRKGKEFIQIFSGSITITPSDNGPVITGKLLGRNDTEYTLNLTCSLPVANRKDTITIDDEGLYIYKEQQKWSIWATTPGREKVVSITIPNLTIAGKYTIDDLEARNSYICLDLSEDGQPREMYRLLDANFTVTYDSVERVAHLVGSVLAKATFELGDICEYYLDVTASYTRVHIVGDAENEDFIHDFTGYNVITKYISSDQSIYIEAQNNDVYAILAFFIPENATELLPGEYSITTSTPKAWTVPAGSYSDGQYYPSFFCNVENGGLVKPLWVPVEGKAVVDANKKITIEAINTYERTIRVTLTPKRQAIDEINADKEATKRVENGMVIIERNGVKYNILGGIIR